jgi:predicted RNA-binding Zn ribbon-like protein
MAVSWTPHRFSGGALALDVTNTVVLRHDPERTFDRFDDAPEIIRFAEAASVQRAHELGGRRLHATNAISTRQKVLALRETTDRLFRGAASSGCLDTADLPPFLSACAAGLDGHKVKLDVDTHLARAAGEPVPFEAAVALSALALLQPQKAGRIRICANCSWLFLDESRNRSRIWCDMAVCGNRQKARRHYRRRTEREATDG